MTAPLAEVVEEGRKLKDITRAACDGQSAFAIAEAADNELAFYRRHFNRLANVAEAAVEMRRVYDYALPILFEGPGGTAAEIEAETMMSEADAAFDAAVRGEP